jgi:hypothetical protein
MEDGIPKSENTMSPTSALALRKIGVDDFELLKVLGKGEYWNGV